jgi:uncharacterized glyoxalase superfamily protein PhnB
MVIPILAYHDIQAVHDYLVDVLGFASAEVERSPSGAVVHAEVRTPDGSRIWLHRHDPEHGLVSPAGVLPTGGVVVIVDDVDAHYEQARKRGAAIDYPPTDQDYGLREYGARDPEGGVWYVASWLTG